MTLTLGPLTWALGRMTMAMGRLTAASNPLTRRLDQHMRTLDPKGHPLGLFNCILPRPTRDLGPLACGPSLLITSCDHMMRL